MRRSLNICPELFSANFFVYTKNIQQLFNPEPCFKWILKKKINDEQKYWGFLHELFIKIIKVLYSQRWYQGIILNIYHICRMAISINLCCGQTLKLIALWNFVRLDSRKHILKKQVILWRFSTSWILYLLKTSTNMKSTTKSFFWII